KQVTSMLAYLTQPDDYNSNAGLKSCWCKDTTNHASSIKFRESAALVAGAIAAGALTPVENPNYNQGFAARRGLLMSANPRGSFSFIIPFDHMFGFAGYDKIIYNVKHSLTLTRSAIDHQPIHKAQGVQDGKIKLTNITWRVPLVAPETVRLVELREIISRKESIPVGFMARNHESSSVPQTRDFTWRLNLTSGIEKPRWIIVGFQTLRNQTQEQNPAVFDHLNVTNAYAMLNSQRYPTYDTINSFQINDYSDFYEKFDNYNKILKYFYNIKNDIKLKIVIIMDMYCVKCKLKTESKNITEVTALNGRKMLKSICSICNCKKSSFTKSETKTGKGIGDTIVKTIGKMGELHLPANKGEYVQNGSFSNLQKYSYCGPGTKYDQRVKEGYNGINELDSMCKLHDKFHNEN